MEVDFKGRFDENANTLFQEMKVILICQNALCLWQSCPIREYSSGETRFIDFLGIYPRKLLDNFPYKNEK